MTKSCTIGWGLIGASNIARTAMIPAINSQPESRVVAVMSSEARRARAFAVENAVPCAYDSLEAILSDPAVDVVYISTTNELHHPQTLAAARAGKHVLCEKPVALALEEALEMATTCRRAGVVLGTNHHLRNAATHRTLRRLVAAGDIGLPLAARVFHAVFLPENLQGWRVRSAAAGGGVIFDITVHDADSLRFVLQDEVEEVTALSARQGLAVEGVEDAVMGVMRFRGGALAQFHDAFTIRHAGTGFEIHGADASLFAHEVMTQLPRGQIFLRRGERCQEVALDEHEDLYIRSVRCFNDAVQGRGEPAATAEDGLCSLAVALAVREAAQTGHTTRVRYP
jgi:1,5-anhydro-D-fructose reductase (1,5-anhydro-D-mannitol-forming)